MRAMIKFFVIVIGLILIAMAVGLWLLRGNIENRILGRMAAMLEQQLGAQVAIDGLSFASGGRALSLDGLSIHARDIDDPDDAFIAHFEKILLYPDYSTILGDQWVLHRLVFINPEIQVRHTGGLNTNINAIGRHLEARTRQLAAAPGDVQREKTEFLIHTMEIFPAKVRVSSASLPIPPIPFTTEKLQFNELSDASLTMPELLTQVYAALTRTLWNLPGLSRFREANADTLED